jgi:ABC-type multidrug transport system ATPase subunit
MQDDILFAAFTPREAIRFAARMKLKLSLEAIEDRVEEIIKELGL